MLGRFYVIIIQSGVAKKYEVLSTVIVYKYCICIYCQVHSVHARLQPVKVNVRYALQAIINVPSYCAASEWLYGAEQKTSQCQKGKGTLYKSKK